MFKYKLKKWQFYLLSFTWGLPMTLLGCIASGILMLCGFRPKKNQYGWYFDLGVDMGGAFELGCMSVACCDPSPYILHHEFGHAIQNCYFGPFMILISLASIIRYWYRELVCIVNKVPYSSLPPYDGIWFEGQATKLGEWYDA
jgi:hypothetical protein